MNALQSVACEKDVAGSNYISVAGKRQIKALQFFAQKPDTELYPEGWEEGLTSDEFLTATKQMLWKKFDDKNQIS